MDAKKFLQIKRKHQLASQPVVQPQPNPQIEDQSQLKPESFGLPPQPFESVDRTYPNPQSELQLPAEPVGQFESLSSIERVESIGGSGWGYSQLLKEFRNDLTCD